MRDIHDMMRDAKRLNEEIEAIMKELRDVRP